MRYCRSALAVAAVTAIFLTLSVEGCGVERVDDGQQDAGGDVSAAVCDYETLDIQVVSNDPVRYYCGDETTPLLEWDQGVTIPDRCLEPEFCFWLEFVGEAWIPSALIDHFDLEGLPDDVENVNNGNVEFLHFPTGGKVTFTVR